MARLISILFVIVFVTAGCAKPSKQYEPPPREMAPRNYVTTSRVIQYADEEKIDSVNRWLWNMMTNGGMAYDNQLDATRLWLLLNGHIKYSPLMAEDESQ
jgi:hypothetical protein